ncbi:GH32 C-terminal domain-containing protein [Zongyangia hominis]|uniref:GH32 C-terminal domain-containing protein n=1 Tax=Zongyangia hominis TaxID=2763677 RepID=A0A926EBT5_9FIRM|nr:GH32 C-terminal domain-containing protein [Zongyangia hominis]MBC8569349.1 GH32 C-terminal domain-containing protein [Zongyangia hominis]
MAVALCLSVAIPGGMSVFAIDGDPSNWNTNLEGIKAVGSLLTYEENGLKVASPGTGFDFFAVSDVKVDGGFTFETDVTIVDGTDRTVGLLFGAASNNVGNDGGIVFNLPENDVNGSRLFTFGGPDYRTNNTPFTPKDNHTYHMKLEVNNKFCKAWIDDVLIHDTYLRGYHGGYLGLMCFKSSAVFQNTQYTVLEDNKVVSIGGMENLKGDFTTPSDDTMVIRKNGGNNHVISDTKMSAFRLESNLLLSDGFEEQGKMAYKASYIFGSVKNDFSENIGDGFFGNELAAVYNGTSYDLKYKMFHDPWKSDIGLADNIVGPIDVGTVENLDTPISYSLTVGADKNLIVTVNGQDFPITTPKAFKDYYTDGYLGIMSFNTKAQVTGLKVTDLSAPKPQALENLKGEHFSKVSDGVYEVANTGGNNYVISDTSVNAFSLEADILFTDPKDENKASFIFGAKSGELNFNTQKFNGAEMSAIKNGDKYDVKVKMFQDPWGVGMGDNMVPLTVVTQVDDLTKPIHYKLTMTDDKQLIFTINGTDFVSKNVNAEWVKQYVGGYLGFMTWNSVAQFSNIQVTDLTGVSISAKLSGLKVDGLDLTPAFAQNTTRYNLPDVPYETESIKVTANVTGNGVLTIGGKEAESGVAIDVPLEVGRQDIQVKIVDAATSVPSITTITVKRNQDPATFNTEMWRPQYHYIPEANWCNDPNGMIYYNNEWHLFYQYNPNTPKNVGQWWGHAVSSDLINWTELPVALEPDSLGQIWSGSCVIDAENKSGLFSTDQGGLVAYYTSQAGHQWQSMAYSEDNGRTWTKYDGNPVIDSKNDIVNGDPLQNNDFRDPNVFWYEPAGKFIMVAAGGPLRIYSSSDLKTWTLESGYDNDHTQYRPEGVSAIYSECPDLFPLPIDGNKDKMKWVYSGAGRYYMLGELKQVNGKWAFVPDDNVQHTMTFAADSYAGQTFKCSPDGRVIMTSWMSNWAYADDMSNITGKFNGGYTLFYNLTLRTTPNGVRLFQEPIEEYKQLRQDAVIEKTDVTISPDGENILKDYRGDQYELVANLRPGNGVTEVGFKLRTGATQETVVKYNVASSNLTMDRSKSGKSPNGSFNGNAISSYKLNKNADGSIDLRIFMDWSSVEVIANSGEMYGAQRIFPDYASIGLEAYSVGGDTQADVTVYPLKSIWRDSEAGGNEPTALYLDAAENTTIYTDDVITVHSRVLPASADQSVEWNLTDADGAVEIISQDATSITFKALKTGSITLDAATKTGGKTASASFSIKEQTFKTNLTGWTTQGGTWSITENGFEGVTGGDGFALGSEVFNDGFKLEGDITFVTGKAALGLVFNAGDSPSNSYCLNFDFGEGLEFGQQYRWFKFPWGGHKDDIAKVMFSDAAFVPEKGKTYHIVLTYKDGKLSYAIGDDKGMHDIFKDVEDPNHNYTGGRIGVMGNNSTVRINNFYVTSLADPASVETKVGDITMNVGGTMDALTAQLPDTVTVKLTDGRTQDNVGITWNTSAVKLNEIGTYDVIGTVDGTDVTTTVKVNIQDPSPVISIDPKEVTLTVEKGADKQAVIAQLPTSVTGTKADGRKVDVPVLGWDFSKVDLNTAGTYTAVGTLKDTTGGLGGETNIISINAIITVKAPDETSDEPPVTSVTTKPSTSKPSIPGGSGSDWKWPEGSSKPADGKENPKSGDNSALPIALAALAVAAGAVVLVSKKKK